MICLSDMTPRDRYNAAHKSYCEIKYPYLCKDGLYTSPKWPKVNTANGLTNAICNYINWIGGIGNRINVGGRLVEGSETTLSGATLSKKKWIKSSTIKGTADIIAMLPNGKTWHIEIKVGKDRPRPEQIKMQERVRSVNGYYDFVHDMEEFFEMLDKI